MTLFIAGGSATRESHPRDPPVRVGRQWNGQRRCDATLLTGKSQLRFTADRNAVMLDDQSAATDSALREQLLHR